MSTIIPILDGEEHAHSRQPPYTVADVFLQALAENGVDYLFTVLGSDHPSLVEAYLRRQKEGKEWPKWLHFQHEFTAISAADGYARITAKPQCVIVHVDVGTSALGQGVHNASSGRSPMLIFAGLAPYTLHGGASQFLGSRSEHVQWYQDVPRQEAIVAPFVRYSNEIKSTEHVKCIVNRALLMASSGSPGPSYLTATREVLASPSSESAMTSRPPTLPSCRIGGLPPDAIPLIADALLFAEKPLVFTGYLGRNHAAVYALVKLANLLNTLQVFDSEFREMSFPADHPAWITRTTGGPKALHEADVILVLDCDVPWVPTKVRPHHAARIFHIDIDPRKEKMQLFDIHAEASFMAECEIALEQITTHIASHEDFPRRQTLFQTRAQHLLDNHMLKLESLALRALPRPDGTITAPHLFATLRRLLPPEAIYLHDAVTNTIPLHEHLQSTLPGTSYSKGGSGLGWAPGAAIGAYLALSKYSTTNRPHTEPLPLDPLPEKKPFICALTADGAFLLSSPTPTLLASSRHKTPFLTIILNNGGWKAPRQSINDVHPHGLAAGMTDREIGFALGGHEDGDAAAPDYVGVCAAATGGWCWGRRVCLGEDLDDAVLEAVGVVRGEGRGAVLEVVVALEKVLG
ncbi:hypothetical protein M409DRAFT_59714 [Zasmidium cellare ATCC 36951]|uniref:Uncharacterized protein n=1 Tax=Zasmidium cellare ATCC 36951 TaxID=1080233 RepID=A0A6A6C0U2_ZASCE|nr:uncharacterized protein M409DRAFT_59714 [Zasmidium cellare ATCC 36951]KAF2160677.1 hypothetical protein M409DRAFT_59714 [Zasmidium cellare ATCC 36951]